MNKTFFEREKELLKNFFKNNQKAIFATQNKILN
jgi:hypothetical protein